MIQFRALQARDATILQLKADLSRADGIQKKFSLRHATERAERAERTVADLQEQVALVGHHQPGRFHQQPSRLQQVHISEARPSPSSSTARSIRHRWATQDSVTTQLLRTGVAALITVADLWWQSYTLVATSLTISQHIPCHKMLVDCAAAFTDLQHAASSLFPCFCYPWFPLPTPP